MFNLDLTQNYLIPFPGPLAGPPLPDPREPRPPVEGAGLPGWLPRVPTGLVVTGPRPPVEGAGLPGWLPRVPVDVEEVERPIGFLATIIFTVLSFIL